MTIEKIDTVIIGGGQAGLAVSYYLGQLGCAHVILERQRVAERWRSERWDSLTFQFPNWAMQLPGYPYTSADPDDFAPRDEVVRFIESYATVIRAPLRCGVAVISLRQRPGSARFQLQTEDAEIEAANVVIATGPYQKPSVPHTMEDAMRDLFQVHSSRYRNPAQLPAGAVLVVGSGNSGCQIAEDLLRGGRRVYLAVSAHRRAPRRYRGRDCTWWQFALGEFDLTTDKRPARKAALKSADEYAQKNGLELPDEDLLHERLPDPKEVSAPILELDLRPAGVSSVIWANGFSYDFGWVNLPVFAEFGIPPRQEPIHQRGVTNVPGLYFIGLPWLSKLKSSLMAGTGEDAAFLAEHIAHR